MICEHCKKDPGAKPTGVWRGFKDADNGQHVCWTCRHFHYREKFEDPELRNLYSELPVVVPPAQDADLVMAHLKVILLPSKSAGIPPDDGSHSSKKQLILPGLDLNPSVKSISDEN